MALIRRFEEEAGRQYQQAKAGGFLHLAIGEEATIVGTTSVMRPDDYLIGTYRTHGHAIARGTDPKRVMAELFGREDGCSRGRGGSMHIFDLERRFMGGYGIVGGNLPLAAGLALACDYKGSDSVTVCMFGDGAANTGNFGETMNIAALWKLPVVFLVENNLYGMGTARGRRSSPRTARRSRRWSRCMTTSTWSATRCAAGTPSTSARPSRTAARRSGRSAPGARPGSWRRPGQPTPVRRAPEDAVPARRWMTETHPTRSRTRMRTRSSRRPPWR